MMPIEIATEEEKIRRKNADIIEDFMKKNKPLDYVEPMSPPDQQYAYSVLQELKTSPPGTLRDLGLSSYTCYRFYKGYDNKDYFLVFSMGELVSYAKY
jgi:hypothetical protein